MVHSDEDNQGIADLFTQETAVNNPLIKSWHIGFFLTIVAFSAMSIVILSWPNRLADQDLEKSPTFSNAKIPYFDRSDLLKNIDTYCKDNPSIKTVTLVGPEGSGKTTLARQYATQQKNAFIWELNAQTIDALLCSLEHLGYALCQTSDEKKVLDDMKKTEDTKKRAESLLSFVASKMKTS